MDSSVGSPSQDQTAEDLLRHPRGAFRTDWPPAAMGGNVRIGIPDGERKCSFQRHREKDRLIFIGYPSQTFRPSGSRWVDCHCLIPRPKGAVSSLVSLVVTHPSRSILTWQRVVCAHRLPTVLPICRHLLLGGRLGEIPFETASITAEVTEHVPAPRGILAARPKNDTGLSQHPARLRGRNRRDRLMR